MSGIWSAWAVAVIIAAWNNGLNDGQWPPPYALLDPTILFGILSLFSKAGNGRIAGLLAWGLVLPLVLIELQQWKNGKGPLAALPFSSFANQSPGAVEASAGSQS